MTAWPAAAPIAAVWLAALGADAPTPSPPAAPPPTVQPAADGSDAPAIDVPGQPPAKIGEAYAAAQSKQGPLDGAWRVLGADGGPLYELEINDPGGGGEVDGAWRDPRRPGTLDSSGVLASVRASADGLEIRFEGGLFPRRLDLKPAPGGGWAGELIHDGPRQAVTMTRF